MLRKIIFIAFFTIIFPYCAWSKQNFSVILLDTQNKQILYGYEEEELRYPASLTKLMTLYLTFSALQNDKLTWGQKLIVSPYAAAQIPSKLGLLPKQHITVKNAVLSLIIKSANDSSIVLAEAISKTEQDFVKLMNKTARKLGMSKTNFVNANGLHHPKQYTTALDMAILASALKNNFSNYYKLFSNKHFFHDKVKIKTTNEIILNYPGADGLKTGYTQASGFNLASSVVKNNYNLVGVVMGAPSSKARAQVMTALLDMGVKKIENKSSLLLAVLIKPNPNRIKASKSDK